MKHVSDLRSFDLLSENGERVPGEAARAFREKTTTRS
jgi:hypothetical protein